MAFTTCSKCGGHGFELKTIEPAAATYKHCVIQCRTCGVPAGITGYVNPAVLIEDLEKKLKRVISAVDDKIDDLSRKVAKLSK